MTKEQFDNWSNQPETEEFFEVVKLLIEDYKDRLSEVAGVDPMNDRFSAGIIHALREIQTVEFVVTGD